MQVFKSTIITKVRPFNLIICLALLIAILTQFSHQLPPTAQDLAFGFIFLLILLYALWLIAGQVTITLTNEKLSVARRLLYINFYKQTVSLSAISNIEIMTNVKASSYFSFGEIKILGFEYTPEWMRMYDIDPIVMYIHHNKGTFKIGTGLQKFGGHKLLQEIKKRQNKL